MELTDALLMSESDIFESFIDTAKQMSLEFEYNRDNYLWIKGNSNIALTAHVDVVSDYQPYHAYDYFLGDYQTDLFEDDLNLSSEPSQKEIKIERGIVTAYRDGKRAILGGDDRCGIFAIDKMLFEVYKGNIEAPHVLLFNGEECGGIGVDKFVSTKPDLSSIDLILAIDCAYTNEFVWYGDNRTADRWVQSFGWKNHGMGSFSDIAIIDEYVDIPSVNLGAGYFNQHSHSEYIDLEVMNLCKNKVFRMLENGYNPAE
jgi:di/tripeptidase